jgi:hypothetical protein
VDINGAVAWLQSSGLPGYMNAHAWAWPACEVLHFIGMATLLGTIGLLDLRMLGLARSIPARPLHRFVQWGLGGFVINLVTGVMFVAGNPFAPLEYISNVAFLLKMAFLILAGVNAGIFYLTGVSDVVLRLGPGDDAPLAAKLIGGTSMCLWLGVIVFGRLLPYLGDAF